MSEEIFPLSIYDQFGKINRNLDPAEIARCSKMQQKILFPVFASLEAAEAAESLHYEAQKATRRAVTALDRSRKAYEAELPQHTFHDEWLITIAKQKPKPVTEAKKKAIAVALTEVNKAEAFLAECQRSEIVLKADEKVMREAFARAVIAWSPVSGIAMNVADLVRARGATERGIAMKNIEAGLPHDHALAAASTVGPSPWDHLRKGSGKGHSANIGTNLNRMRGATIPKPQIGE
jgi:hypothetical protein